MIRDLTELPAASAAIHERVPQPETPDDARLAALRRKDTNAWTALFEEHRHLVFRAALTQVQDRAVAEDVTSQVFLEAVEGIGRYRDRGKPIAAWLLAIARQRSLDALRKQRRQARLGPAAADGAWAMTAAPAFEALDILTPEQREVMHLRFVEERSIEEVAALTGRTTAAVKSLQHRALRQLRARTERRTGGLSS